MILDTIIVHVPAQREVDADLAEYGHLSLKSRAQYGEAAVQAGDPYYTGDSGDGFDPDTSAVDAIANILHWLNDYSSFPLRALDTARMHFEAELDG